MDTLDLLATRVPNHALPRGFYTDADIFAADLREIWYREWLFAIPACEVPAAGSFVTMQVGDYAVLIVRGADGKIRAFHNSCRHRGAIVCREREGNARRLFGFYHGWP